MVTSSISGSTNISATHQRPKPEDIFKKMDTDGSGSVSKEEFESAFVQISQKGEKAADGATSTDTTALKAKADEIYAKMDSDGDGSLSASEFQTAAKAQEAQHSQGAKGAHGGHRGSGGGDASAGASSSSQKTYDPADTNKDGVVSTQEAAVYKAQQAQEAVKTYTDVQAATNE